MAPGLIELVTATLAVIGALCLKHFDDTRRWKTSGKVVMSYHVAKVNDDSHKPA